MSNGENILDDNNKRDDKRNSKVIHVIICILVMFIGFMMGSGYQEGKSLGKEYINASPERKAVIQEQITGKSYNNELELERLPNRTEERLGQNATGELSSINTENELIEEKDVKSRVMTAYYRDGTTKKFSCLRKNKADKLLCENPPSNLMDNIISTKITIERF